VRGIDEDHYLIVLGEVFRQYDEYSGAFSRNEQTVDIAHVKARSKTVVNGHHRKNRLGDVCGRTGVIDPGLFGRNAYGHRVKKRIVLHKRRLGHEFVEYVAGIRGKLAHLCLSVPIRYKHQVDPVVRRPIPHQRVQGINLRAPRCCKQSQGK
jgi:hypothetical protein